LFTFKLVLALPDFGVVAGSASVEKDIQTEREKNVLSFVYLNKETIPDSPSEPTETISGSENNSPCMIIPMEEISSSQVCKPYIRIKYIFYHMY